ncbi:hypothetical protein FPOAC2_04612 [Fusarium poae]|jgi:hypothetical protein|uniref:hypothetical protein n=1 Tax=Fusarium poae TaxID=36050 RepID=UPI001CE81C92|nr:hypothetical protein FPOAC1_004525 [Fusarium poae]KAG8671281.1 hypothetical protein FPOAC1_004525 [Fusarium poae]
MSAFNGLPTNYLMREDCIRLVNDHYDLFFEFLPFIEVGPKPTAILTDPQGTVVLWAQNTLPRTEWVDMTHFGVRRTLFELADSGAFCDEYQMIRYQFMPPFV